MAVNPHRTNHFLSIDRFFVEKSDTPPLCGGVVHSNMEILIIYIIFKMKLYKILAV